jgi:hypothetical protein
LRAFLKKIIFYSVLLNFALPFALAAQVTQKKIGNFQKVKNPMTVDEYLERSLEEDSLDSVVIVETRKRETLEELFIKGDITISEWFDAQAEGLDLFLVGKKVTNRKNKSSLKLEHTSASFEGMDVVHTAKLIAQVHLPNLEDYWQLKFSSFDEREERRGASKSYLQKERPSENYGATVGLYRQLGSIRTAYQPRIEFGKKLEVSQSLSIDGPSPEIGSFFFHPKLEFYASPIKGTGVYTSLNLSRFLKENLSLTLINDADYLEKPHLLSVNNGFSFGQMLSESSSLNYNLIFNSINQPNYQLNGYFISISWQQILYKNILYYQFTPHLDFLKSFGFRASAGAFLIVTLVF